MSSSILTSPSKKAKIDLSDYNFRRDINSRLLMNHFNAEDVEVLNEILSSSLNIPMRRLVSSVNVEEEQLNAALEKLSRAGLLARHGESIVVDKETRKHYEIEASKFDEDFRPDMEYFQQLLKKVPIHVLPVWYAISKTADNIFDSIIEKYLATPQVYGRYLQELQFEKDILNRIVEDLFKAPMYTISAKSLKEKYSLSEEEFIKNILILEFHCVCFSSYRKQGHEWQEVITPFYEWREYLDFLEDTENRPIDESKGDIDRKWGAPFCFILTITELLKAANEVPLVLEEQEQLPQALIDRLLPAVNLIPEYQAANYSASIVRAHFQAAMYKSCFIKLMEIDNNRLKVLPASQNWLSLSSEDQAMYLYRHPLNRISPKQIPAELYTDRNIREIEKSLKKVLNAGWVYYDDFVRSLTIGIGDIKPISLVKQGLRWKYKIPQYSDRELALIKAIIFERLSEVGFVQIGKHNDKPCFCVTPFGGLSVGK
ncbi:MAG: hypothetical protein K0S74_1433 [Chlamydiales bacterium]|jgi:predicted transcriptional regulator|nr:hypothetical protein [Chlamydiales bacterium]